jgi:hypothetical protein
VPQSLGASHHLESPLTRTPVCVCVCVCVRVLTGADAAGGPLRCGVGGRRRATRLLRAACAGGGGEARLVQRENGVQRAGGSGIHPGCPLRHAAAGLRLGGVDAGLAGGCDQHGVLGGCAPEWPLRTPRTVGVTTWHDISREIRWGSADEKPPGGSVCGSFELPRAVRRVQTGLRLCKAPLWCAHTRVGPWPHLCCEF